MGMVSQVFTWEHAVKLSLSVPESVFSYIFISSVGWSQIHFYAGFVKTYEAVDDWELHSHCQ